MIPMSFGRSAKDSPVCSRWVVLNVGVQIGDPARRPITSPVGQITRPVERRNNCARRASSIPGSLSLRDDGHRARRMEGQVSGDRTQHETGESTVAARADDEASGVL